MNTNNAPKRIDHELCEKNARTIIEKADKYHGWDCIDYPVAVAYLKMREDMQPQVSESDEPWMARQACREIASNTITAEAEYGARMCSDAIDELIDKRSKHRQPAAVSADAVEELFDLEHMKHNSAQCVSEKWIERHKTTAGWSDQAVMAWAYEDLRSRLAKAHDIISALSPETVCGGGE